MVQQVQDGVNSYVRESICIHTHVYTCIPNDNNVSVNPDSTPCRSRK